MNNRNSSDAHEELSMPESRTSKNFNELANKAKSMED